MGPCVRRDDRHQGFRVPRFWNNNEVLSNTDGVPEAILSVIDVERRNPSPVAPLRGAPPTPTAFSGART